MTEEDNNNSKQVTPEEVKTPTKGVAVKKKVHYKEKEWLKRVSQRRA